LGSNCLQHPCFKSKHGLRLYMALKRAWQTKAKDEHVQVRVSGSQEDRVKGAIAIDTLIFIFWELARYSGKNKKWYAMSLDVLRNWKMRSDEGNRSRRMLMNNGRMHDSYKKRNERELRAQREHCSSWLGKGHARLYTEATLMSWRAPGAPAAEAPEPLVTLSCRLMRLLPRM